MKLPAFLKCPDCKAPLLLSEDERVAKKFTCPECGYGYDYTSSEIHPRTIGSFLSGEDIFTVTVNKNEIHVVYLPNKEVIALYNGDIVARKLIHWNVLAEEHELIFAAKEQGRERIYRVVVYSSTHDTTYSLYCSIYRQGKLIFGDESATSKAGWHALVIFSVVLILLILLSR